MVTTLSTKQNAASYIGNLLFGTNLYGGGIIVLLNPCFVVVDKREKSLHGQFIIYGSVTKSERNRTERFKSLTQLINS